MPTKLVFLMGPPCVGKSVIAIYIQDTHEDCVIISKTKILKAHPELSVFSSMSNKIYCKQINQALQTHKVVVADDTQTTLESRIRVFKNLNLNNVKVIGVWVESSLKSALTYNDIQPEADKLNPFVIKEIFRYAISPKEHEPFNDLVFINRETCIGVSKSHPKIDNIMNTLKQI